jgi:hypothetical protein
MIMSKGFDRKRIGQDYREREHRKDISEKGETE